MEALCYLNGTLLPLAEAKVSVLDLGMLRSFGIYEGITAVNGEPFHFTEHFARFAASTAKLGLTLPVTQAQALEATRTLLAHNAPKGRASIRMLLTGGEALGGLEHVPGRETFYLIAEPAEPLPAQWYEAGATLLLHEHQRFMPGVKTINYITAVMHQPRRKEARAAEVLYHAGNQVLECATSNICMVKDGAVITPKDGILPGITRKVTLELARAAGYPVEERAVTLEELYGADEAFITSSFKDIVPVVAIENTGITTGIPGPITRALMARFAAELEKCAQ